MIRVYVADAFALEALFGGHPVMMGIHARAESGRAILVLPSLAMLAATASTRASEAAWEAVLFPAGAHVADLSATSAIGLGGDPNNPVADVGLGELQVAQSAWEARMLGAETRVVTTDPGAYRTHQVPGVIDIRLS